MARIKVLNIVVDRLAKVLHTRPEDISRARPLRELGLDSLMTLELAMDLESAVSIDFSMADSVGALTIPVLVDQIIARASSPQDLEPQAMPGTSNVEAGQDIVPEKAGSPVADPPAATRNVA